MNVIVQIVQAFIDGRDGGNPAGVVVDAASLSEERMQEVARRVAHSETVFVSPSAVATVRLDFFTPTRRIAHCGHGTVGAFVLLRRLGLIDDGLLSKETIDGTLGIRVGDGLAFLEQRAPKYLAVDPASEIGERALSSLGLEPSELAPGLEPAVVNTGNAYLMVPLPDERAVAGLRPRAAEVEAISEELDLIGYYAFSPETRVAGRHAGARMFAPRYGIPEESATGTAAGNLACFLHHWAGLRDRRILIEQGWLMATPSPSLLTVDLELAQGAITSLMVGGAARPVSTLRVDV